VLHIEPVIDLVFENNLLEITQLSIYIFHNEVKSMHFNACFISVSFQVLMLSTRSLPTAFEGLRGVFSFCHI